MQGPFESVMSVAAVRPQTTVKPSQANRRHATVYSRLQGREAAGGGVRCFSMAERSLPLPLYAHPHLSLLPPCTSSPLPSPSPPHLQYLPHHLDSCIPSPIRFCLHMNHFLSSLFLFPSPSSAPPPCRSSITLPSFLPSYTLAFLTTSLTLLHSFLHVHFYTPGPLSTFSSLPFSSCSSLRLDFRPFLTFLVVLSRCASSAAVMIKEHQREF